MTSQSRFPAAAISFGKLGKCSYKTFLNISVIFRNPPKISSQPTAWETLVYAHISDSEVSITLKFEPEVFPKLPIKEVSTKYTFKHKATNAFLLPPPLVTTALPLLSWYWLSLLILCSFVISATRRGRSENSSVGFIKRKEIIKKHTVWTTFFLF